jgi:hypothetical protein
MLIACLPDAESLDWLCRGRGCPEKMILNLLKLFLEGQDLSKKRIGQYIIAPIIGRIKVDPRSFSKPLLQFPWDSLQDTVRYQGGAGQIAPLIEVPFVEGSAIQEVYRRARLR